MSGALVRVGTLAGRVGCGQRFWAYIHECHEASQLGFLSLDEWETAFDIARDEGMMELEPGNMPIFRSPFGYALLRQWREVRDARISGTTSRQLSLRQNEAVNAARALQSNLVADHERKRANVMRENADERAKYSRKEQRVKRAAEVANPAFDIA